jgi:signal-transduction protein with cAMP-binding, CBS, and nucleotidyltransferase domain
MDTPITRVLASKGHDAHAVTVGTRVTEAARKMADLGIGAVLVERDGQVAGILTERDLARRVCFRELDPADTPVEQVMTSPVAYITTNATVADTMKVMSETHCRHLPVFEAGELVGVISLGDLIRWVTADLEGHIRYLETYITRG